MISIRDGLIKLGFCRTMYAENKQNSIEGVYDGIYNSVFVSLEVFANGYIARVENSLEHQTSSNNQTDLKASPIQKDSNSAVKDSSPTSPLTSPGKEEIISYTAMKTQSIRSEVLTMQDILHSLEKLTTNLQIKEQSTSP